MIKVENGKLEVNGDVFIIPNGMGTVNDFISGKEFHRRVLDAIQFASNGTHIDDKSLLVETWIVSKELGTDNLSDHGGKYIGEDGEIHGTGHLDRYIPFDLLNGHKEGDVVDITIPRGTYDFNEGFDIVLHLRLAQKEYRYSRFGSFEDVLKRLYDNH